ncbi:DUF5518 domain-containing protein [Halobacteria archaeon AArc-m2/3/4]|uniref:DUF5518 domain-containing protein n=1 Tax=Natronoglomus mannanivorans TaxID=2979990 RepID=A0ABT2QGW4_9EURY|nr:DUF5518 domain-containing protein [Halobacteria archaeon AArc-m2/3/4]
MNILRSIRSDVSDEQFRVAVLLGIGSIPLTVGINWLLTPDPVSATPLFFACVCSGYLYRSRSIDGTRAGVVTGLVGGVPVLIWQSWTALIEWWNHPRVIAAVGDSLLLAAASVGAALVTGAIVSVVLVVIGMIGGGIGSWLNERLSPTRLHGSKT